MDNDFNKIALMSVLASVLGIIFTNVFGTTLLTQILFAIVTVAGAIIVNMMAEGLWCEFSYVLITSAVPLVSIGLTKLGFIETDYRFLLHEAAVAVFVPIILAIGQALYQRDVERNGFAVYFKEQLVYIAFIYGCYMVYSVFIKDMSGSFPEKTQLIPFATLAGYIEAVINKIIPVNLLLMYLLSTVLVYVPYGFITAAFTERLLTPVRVSVLLILPLVSELVQLFVGKNMCDIDDVFFGFVGALVGAGIWKLLNALFFAVMNHGCLGQSKNPDL